MNLIATNKKLLSSGFFCGRFGCWLRHYKECNIIGADLSGAIPLGLSFGLRVEIPEEFTRNYLGVISDKSFGQSVPIKLSEVRRSEMWGASFAANNNYIVQMFSPQDIRDALVLAREWTDRWFAYNPEARERAILRRAEAPGLAHVQSMRA